MFYIFIRACRKYKFTYVMSTYMGLTIILRPNNTFDNIELKQNFYCRDYNKLFLQAIKEMKRYRKERGNK